MSSTLLGRREQLEQRLKTALLRAEDEVDQALPEKQEEALQHYEKALSRFSRLVVCRRLSGNSATAIPAPEFPTDLQIEQWVQKQYGFVPHPYWISHCRELYIAGTESIEENRRPGHECPPDKRAALKEAFLHFRMLKP